jgi:diphthamide synthase (EF-2-diphthine--ammonia ligase)
VNEQYLDQSFVGRTINEEFLRDLPHTVDPCGENGEFHSFVYDGPIFHKPIEFTKGETVFRKYYRSGSQKERYSASTGDDNNPFKYGLWYCDLVPGDKSTMPTKTHP